MATILGLSAAPDDEALKASFFYLIPNADEIRKYIKDQRSADGPNFRHKFFFDDKSGIASYVALTTDRDVCLTARNVTRAEAEAIEGRLDDTSRMVLPEFQDVVEAALGASVNFDASVGTYGAKWWVMR